MAAKGKKEKKPLYEKQKYIRELGNVGHLDFGHACQDLHQVQAFVCLEPTGEEEAGEKKHHVRNEIALLF